MTSDATEASDRPMGPDDVVPCPDSCTRPEMHRHLADGAVLTAYRGFGVTESGEVMHGAPVMRGDAHDDQG